MTDDEALLIIDRIRNLVMPASLTLQSIYVGRTPSDAEVRASLDAIDKLCAFADSLKENPKVHIVEVGENLLKYCRDEIAKGIKKNLDEIP